MTRIEEAEESKLEKTVADMQEMFKKHLPNTVFRFSVESSNRRKLAYLEMKNPNLIIIMMN